MLKLTTQETTVVGEDVEKGKTSYTVRRNANWCSHSGKQYGGSSKKLKIELSYDPAIVLLGINPRDTGMLFRRSTCTPMFIAALPTIAKIWKEPNCPSMDEWIKKMWYIYTMKYYTAIQKNEILPFATTWMELEGIMLSEISQRKTTII